MRSRRRPMHPRQHGVRLRAKSAALRDPWWRASAPSGRARVARPTYRPLPAPTRAASLLGTTPVDARQVAAGSSSSPSFPAAPSGISSASPASSAPSVEAVRSAIAQRAPGLSHLTTVQRVSLPDGRTPRGGFISPKTFSPMVDGARPMVQVDGSETANAAPGSMLWESLRPAPVMVNVDKQPDAPTVAPRPVATGGKASNAAAAMPLLRMVQGGTVQQTSQGARFYEEARPSVAPVLPRSESTAQMVQALRTGAVSTSGDDRVTLGDMTLISIAAATNQLAASAAGEYPRPPRQLRRQSRLWRWQRWRWWWQGRQRQGRRRARASGVRRASARHRYRA